MLASKYAHRGIYDNKTVFENTLSAFENAINRNKAIELDLRITKDKIIVVAHDADLKRLNGSKLNIASLTYEELKQYPFENGDVIPMFSELLSLVRGRVPLLIEVKYMTNNKEACMYIYELLSDYKGEYAIQSFNPFVLTWFKRFTPNTLRGQLLMPINRYGYMVVGIFMHTFILHLFTKPTFYSYEKKMGRNKFTRFIYSHIAGHIAVWTLKPDEAHHFSQDVSLIIKESI